MILARPRRASGLDSRRLSIADRLASAPLFSHFQRPQLEELAALVEARRVPRETFVLRQGDSSSSDAFLIEGGGVRIQRSTPYGNFALAVLATGDLFGEASFVDSSARSGVQDALHVGCGESVLRLALRAVAGVPFQLGPFP